MNTNDFTFLLSNGTQTLSHIQITDQLFGIEVRCLAHLFFRRVANAHEL